MSVEIEISHVVIISDEEMTVLKLIAEAFIAMHDDTDLPRQPTDQEQETLLAFCHRIKEM